jgi:NAD+ diphosphatase
MSAARAGSGDRKRGEAGRSGSPHEVRTIVDFQLQNVPLLSRIGADRADQVRTDVNAATEGWPEAALLRLDSRNQVLVANGRVVLESAKVLGDKPPPDAVFLGRIEDGRHVWAIRGQLEAPDDPDLKIEVADLRRGGQLFDDVAAQLVSTAAALLNWHASARFSAVDGSPTKPIRAGWARVNPLTGHEEFPRIDPAVICLVHDGADRAVLARQTVWPERMFSLLAGFVEAGESFEMCVVREIREEIGLSVHDVRYLGSQPWPFPRSLMVGFHAIGDPGEEFSFNDGEIAEAAWFTRDEVRAALALGDWSSAADATLLLPGSVSIARVIIESWAALD